MLGGKKTGGMNVYVRDFSRELGRQGILVDVFTRSQDDCQPMVKHDLGFDGRVIHIPAGPEQPIPLADIPQYLDEFVHGVLDFAADEGIQYDLIHSHYWLSGLVAEKLRECWHVPIVQMFHTLGHMKNQIATSDSERAPQERIEGENYVIHHVADRLIAATPAEEEQLVSLYGADPQKIVIIPPGVDLERFHPLDKKEAKRRVGIPCGDANILFAGRIEPLKGIDTMLRAMAIIQQRCPTAVENCCMAIIGGDPWADDLDEEMARLQELRNDLEIHDLVVFLGAKDQEILPNYYAAAEMVVMPSHYESFGMVALEAMAMGTPVIASEVGGLAHLVKHGETGYHVPSRDPEALARRIFDLLSNPNCREHMGKEARNHAQAYAWPKIVNQMMQVYCEIATPQEIPGLLSELGRLRDGEIKPDANLPIS
ncbi:MAG: glycosyltransferase family 1 protein [Anaerolineae bacterium]|nr:glycosyltransferase family 1 protein [Anaerolineae bacterium]